MFNFAPKTTQQIQPIAINTEHVYQNITATAVRDGITDPLVIFETLIKRYLNSPNITPPDKLFCESLLKEASNKSNPFLLNNLLNIAEEGIKAKTIVSTGHIHIILTVFHNHLISVGKEHIIPLTTHLAALKAFEPTKNNSLKFKPTYQLGIACLCLVQAADSRHDYVFLEPYLKFIFASRSGPEWILLYFLCTEILTILADKADADQFIIDLMADLFISNNNLPAPQTPVKDFSQLDLFPRSHLNLFPLNLYPLQKILPHICSEDKKREVLLNLFIHLHYNARQLNIDHTKQLSIGSHEFIQTNKDLIIQTIKNINEVFKYGEVIDFLLMTKEALMLGNSLNSAQGLLHLAFDYSTAPCPLTDIYGPFKGIIELTIRDALPPPESLTTDKKFLENLCSRLFKWLSEMQMGVFIIDHVTLKILRNLIENLTPNQQLELQTIFRKNYPDYQSRPLTANIILIYLDNYLSKSIEKQQYVSNPPRESYLARIPASVRTTIIKPHF